MAAFSYNLKALQARVNDLIDEQGEDAPVAWWIYTAEDVFTIDDNGDEEYQPTSVCEEVLSDLQDIDYIHTVIVDCIEDSLKSNAQWESHFLPSWYFSALWLVSTLSTLFQTFKMQNNNASANQSRKVQDMMKCVGTSADIVRKYKHVDSDGDWDDIMSPDDYDDYIDRRRYERSMRGY